MKTTTCLVCGNEVSHRKSLFVPAFKTLGGAVVSGRICREHEEELNRNLSEAKSKKGAILRRSIESVLPEVFSILEKSEEIDAETADIINREIRKKISNDFDNDGKIGNISISEYGYGSKLFNSIVNEKEIEIGKQIIEDAAKFLQFFSKEYLTISAILRDKALQHDNKVSSIAKTIVCAKYAMGPICSDLISMADFTEKFCSKENHENLGAFCAKLKNGELKKAISEYDGGENCKGCKRIMRNISLFA